MASKQTYECFVCKKNGFPETRVYLDGKDANGKTIYKNEDLSPHQHKQQAKQLEQQPQASKSTTIVTQATQNDMIIKKLDRIISALESQNRMFGLLLDPQQREKLKQWEQTIEK
jgi:hypothetical protein